MTTLAEDINKFCIKVFCGGRTGICRCGHEDTDHHPLAKRCLIYLCDCDQFLDEGDFKKQVKEMYKNQNDNNSKPLEKHLTYG